MAQHTICPRCAKRLPPSARFCRRCGMTQKVSSSAAAATAAAGTAANIGTGAFGLPLNPAPPAYTPPPQYPWTRSRPKRPATRGPSLARAGSRGGAGSGCWIFVLLGIFFVRACITTTSHWSSDPPPPPVRPMPSHHWTPPVELDEGLKHLQHQHHTDPFDRRYFPDPPDPVETPAVPAAPDPAPPADRPTE